MILLPRRWERDSHARMGASPQAIVNPQIVDRSHILIGVFWTRLGTPTDEADSGTAEEIERFVAAGKPAHLYFSNEAIPADVNTSEFDRLRDYKAKLKTQGLLGEFDAPEELARQVTVALNEDVREIVARSTEAPKAGAASDRPNLVIDQVAGNHSGVRVTLRNAGTVTARNVVVGLDGALFMLNADHERIGGDTVDEIGDLAPGSTRGWNVLRSAQTPNGRLHVTADGIERFEVELN